MIHAPLQPTLARWVAVLAVPALAVAVTGCAQVLGLEPWIDPPKATGSDGGGGGDVDGTSATSSSGASTGGCLPVGLNATCADCTKNGSETDIDCGGDSCDPCGAQSGCQSDGDCLSASCEGNRCQFGVAGTRCRGPMDCVSGSCQTSTAEATCL